MRRTACAGPEAALAWLEREPCELVIQDMNFSRRTTGEEGLALLARIKALAPALPVDPHHRVGIDRARRRRHEGRRGRLHHQAVDEPADPADGADGARPGRQPRRRLPTTDAPTREELDARYDFGTLVGRDPRLLPHPAADRPRGAAPTPRCWSPARAARARSWSPRRSTATAAARSGPFVKVNLGGHLGVALRERDVRPRQGRLHRRACGSQGPIRGGARRHDLPRRDRRPRRGVAGEDAARAAGPHASRCSGPASAARWTCAWSRRPTATSPRWSRAASSARTCSIASTSSPCTCRRCASAATTSRCSRAGSSRRSGEVYRREGAAPERRRDAPGCRRSPGPGTSASCGSRSSARCSSPSAACSRPTTSAPPPTWNRGTPRVIRCRPSAA